MENEHSSNNNADKSENYPNVPSSLSIVNEKKQIEINNDDFNNEGITNKKAANSSLQLQQEVSTTSSADSK